MKLNESGLTAIELILGIAITALIATAATMTIFQIISSSQRTSNWTMAIRQAQSVGYWVSQDVITAQSITIGDVPETAEVEFITVQWKDWETGDTHDIRYVWLDSIDSLKKIRRDQLSRDRNGVEINNKTTLVADNIYSASFLWQDDAWRLSVEARSGTKSVTREYEINQRL